MHTMNISGYRSYDGEAGSHTEDYLVKPLLGVLRRTSGTRIFELGCGNGAVAARLARLGYEVVAVDPSTEGIRIAQQRNAGVGFHIGSSEDDLAGKFGRFPVVVSLEVVEHVYLPRKYAQIIYNLLEPGGTAVISTPYHGYFKNLALALAGQMDQHFTALWDYGHIKFWSVRTLGALLREAGFRELSFQRLGRIPPLAKSMLAVARK